MFEIVSTTDITEFFNYLGLFELKSDTGLDEENL
jgi:hypothetical protein